MKTCSTALAAHLQQGQTTLAYLWKITRQDSTVLAFTSFDRNLTYNDVIYEALGGFTLSARAGKSDLTPDNHEADLFLESDFVTEADIRAGKYDEAALEIRIVNWADLTMGDVLLTVGTLGTLKMKNGNFHSEVRGLAYKYTKTLGRTYGPGCRATFGSGLNGIDMTSQWKCMVDVTLWQQDGSVAAITTDPSIIDPDTGLLRVGASTDAGDPAPAGWFDDGVLLFTSGVLAGGYFQINHWDGTLLTMQLPLPAPPAPGDTFTITPGCDHTQNDCFNKYNNIVNMRAELTIPGTDEQFDWTA
jgi:uncharacterized phage protein (TIGR02218 family)